MDRYIELNIPTDDRVPKGYKLILAYAKEEGLDEQNHNCDWEGCSSISHVIRISPQQKYELDRLSKSPNPDKLPAAVFVKQTVCGQGIGNCYGACIASLTGIPLEKFPVLTNQDTNTYMEKYNQILKEYGYHLIPINYQADLLPGLCIVTGESLNYPGQLHCVIYENGKMIFDPSPGNKGIKEPQYIDVIAKTFFKAAIEGRE